MRLALRSMKLQHELLQSLGFMNAFTKVTSSGLLRSVTT